MKMVKVSCLFFITCLLLAACDVVGEEDVSNDKIEYLETLSEDETVKGITYENEDGTFGKIINCGEETVTIKIYKWIVDETAPNGFYIDETDYERKLEINKDVQVWVMNHSTVLNSRISYDDINNYEKEKGRNIIWGFGLDNIGKVEYIYEPLIP